MKRSFVLYLSLMATVHTAVGQTEAKSATTTVKEVNDFYNFEIPSAINGSNLDPSGISNVSSSFTDSKLSIKLGFPYVFKEIPDSVDLTYTGFIQPYAKATNGVSTLWNANSRPVEFGATGGISKIISRSKWFYVQNGKVTDRISSQSVQWINIIATLEKGNYNVFDIGKDFGNIIDKRTESNGSIYITFNRYFFSQMPRYRYKSHILSFGLGYAKTNNYLALKSRNFQEGKIVYNADSSSSQAVVETIAGRSGVFEIYKGFAGFGELFIPLVRDKKYGSIYFGNQISYYGIGASDYIVNGTTGFYFNVKDKKVVGNKSAKDVVNFSIVGQFKQLNRVSEVDYSKNNFSVLLQAAVPIRFN